MSSRPYHIIEGRYLANILEQPEALRATLAGLRAQQHLCERLAEIRAREHARIVLTGMGSSLHALYPLEITLAAQGETVCRLETSELVHSFPALLSEKSIIVAVSQSGQSAETVRLLQQNQGRARIIGITNTKGSPLDRKADLSILTDAGDEFSVSTKTYVASLVALEAVAAAWSGCEMEQLYGELSGAPELLANYLAAWREHVDALANELLPGVQQFFVLGRGSSLASCGTGALIMKESTRSFAEGMSSAAFRHGPLEVVSPESLVLVFDGTTATRALNRKLVKEIRERGGKAETLGPGGGLGAFRFQDGLGRMLNILEIAPIQMLTLAIAARAGMEAGRFEHAVKITAEE